jgi:translation elongation factor P/translation initiation factor 5A
MKKLILSMVVVGLTLVSCAKDRQCTCQTAAVVAGNDQPLTTPTSTSVTKIKISKRDAKIICSDSRYVDELNNGSYTKCTLK